MGLLDIAQLSEDQARALIERIRWDGAPPVCPHCGVVDEATKLNGTAHRKGVYQCRACRKQFTATVGTVLHRSRVPLVKWLMAIFLICSSKKGTSALQIQRQLNLGSYKTAWFLCHRIRYAMEHGWDAQLGEDGGTVEVDETWVGGKPRRGEKKRKCGRGTTKTPVVALVDRRGRAVAVPVKDVGSLTLGSILRKHIDRSATLMTDENSSYTGPGKAFKGGHHFTTHNKDEFSRHDTDPVTGADIHVHSNTAESYFSLLKRQHIGAHHKWSDEHLHRYCAELSFRWERRKQTDWERTVAAIKGADGRRLTYDALPSSSPWQ
jgi:transposase-like protein